MTPDQAYEQLLYGQLLNVSGTLSLLVILAMLLERALALVFEYHWFQELSKRYPGLKTPIAFAVSWLTCHLVQFDILSKLFSTKPTTIGIIITSAIVAGGSAGAIILFQGVLNFSREARISRIEARKVNAKADLAEATARKNKAEADAAEALSKKEKVEAESLSAISTRNFPAPPIDEEADSCCAGRIEHITSDEDLPAAEGGVLPL